MRRSDSVIQKCVVGGRSGAESSGERYTLSSIPLSQWHSSRNEKKAAEVCWLVRSRTETGSHRAVLGSRVRYCKNLEIFMACILFSTFLCKVPHCQGIKDPNLGSMRLSKSH